MPTDDHSGATQQSSINRPDQLIRMKNTMSAYH
jgi:hypothetical protein